MTGLLIEELNASESGYYSVEHLAAGIYLIQAGSNSMQKLVKE
jgi:hypothetical protein